MKEILKTEFTIGTYSGLAQSRFEHLGHGLHSFTYKKVWLSANARNSWISGKSELIFQP